MSKIKVTLANGSVLEKPLVTCFKGTTGDYLVLDNETNGQMGYPIICICKFNGTSVEKIIDPNEWSSVKENLKTIIAGTALPYLPVPSELTANDDFYTQLTLPVASFDLLKNTYSVPSPNADIVPPAPTMADVTPVPEAPTAPASPVPDAAPIMGENAIASAPAMPTPEAPSTPAMPEIPVAPAAPAAPAAPTEPVAPALPSEEPIIAPPVIDEPEGVPAVDTPAPAATPAVEVPTPDVPVPAAAPGNDLTSIKDTFMKSCETMFDALVKQLENK